MAKETPKEVKTPILPLHPALVERMFYKPKEWEKEYRSDELLRGGKPAQPDLGASLAGFLEFLAPMFQAKLALDLGTSLGYSSHVLAQIVGSEGSVLSVEREPALARRARENLKKTGLDKRVAVIMGDAGEVMQELTGPYDLILMDVDKAQYLDLFPRVIELLAVGGHLIVDDVGFLSRDFEPKLRHFSLHIARFIKALLQHPSFESIYIPLGDGLVIARKLPTGTEKQLNIFSSTSSVSVPVSDEGQKPREMPLKQEHSASQKKTSSESSDTLPEPKPIRNLATTLGIVKPLKTES